MRRPALRFVARLAGAAAASGLAIAGLVVVAIPASAAACSGSTGVTVVVDNGGSISTTCASGNPASAWAALEAAGYGVTPVATQPGAICKINGYPDTACLRMPPASAYWAFFHAKRGGSWVYSSSGAKSYDPPSGSVVGFRFGSGQQPRVAPPAPTKTSAPVPTKTTTKPKPTTSAPRPTTPKSTSARAPTPKATTGSAPSTRAGGAPSVPPATGQASGSTAAAPPASATASASASPSTSATDASSSSPSEAASDLAAAPTSTDADDGGPGTLIAGGALVVLVGGAAGWAAWKRRT